jgi:hypothetical protein
MDIESLYSNNNVPSAVWQQSYKEYGESAAITLPGTAL